jgi:hypothetical protein
MFSSDPEPHERYLASSQSHSSSFAHGRKCERVYCQRPRGEYSAAEVNSCDRQIVAVSRLDADSHLSPNLSMSPRRRAPATTLPRARLVTVLRKM